MRVLIGCMDCVYFRDAKRWRDCHCLKRAQTLYCADARKDESLCGKAGRWFKDSGRTYFPDALPNTGEQS